MGIIKTSISQDFDFERSDDNKITTKNNLEYSKICKQYS